MCIYCPVGLFACHFAEVAECKPRLQQTSRHRHRHEKISCRPAKKANNFSIHCSLVIVFSLTCVCQFCEKGIGVKFCLKERREIGGRGDLKKIYGQTGSYFFVCTSAADARLSSGHPVRLPTAQGLAGRSHWVKRRTRLSQLSSTNFGSTIEDTFFP